MKTTSINSKPTPAGDKSDELERIKAASTRLVERARQDPKVARAFLRDIGYYRIMGIADPDNSPKIKAEKIKAATRKTTARKFTSANGKITRAKETASAKR